MFALLPIIGGVLAGWLAPRRLAIVLQVVFWAIAVAVLTLTAPDHGGDYRDMFLIAPALALLSAGTLLLGLWIARRRVPQP
ncbi:MAG TPA: hypothetical protein VGP26_05935 [Actinophytocola sp.]|jgi:hypothetical protein|nr:hypothetical protein [Actinophytocola sp.]